tara:strand:- start:3567 stop:5090 length:1524 start_codon:yes stop_codon:yes gene_type:complete
MIAEQQLEIDLRGGRLAPCTLQIHGTLKASNDGACSSNVFINTVVDDRALFSDHSLLKGDFLQLPLAINLIETQKTLFLAPNGAKTPKRWLMSVHDDNYVVERLLDGLVQSHHAPERFHREIHKTALRWLLACALNAHRRQGQALVGANTGYAADPVLNPNRITPRVTNRLLRYLADQGLVTYIIGRANQYQCASSWFVAMPTLIRQIQCSKITLIRNAPQIEIRNEKGKSMPLPKRKTERLKIEKMEQLISRYNNLLIEQYIELDGIEITPYTRRVFNRTLYLGGRFYSDYSNFPKQTRSRITINDSATIELDFKSLHFNLLYADTSIELTNDPYLVAGYARDTIKLISFILLNSDNLSALAGCITRSGMPPTKHKAYEYQKCLSIYNKSKAAGLKAKPPSKPKALEGFIAGIPDDTRGSELIASLLDRHESIAHLLGVPDIGLKLQYRDSQILAACIERATAENIPVLTIHDSIISMEQHKGLIYEVMSSSYYEATGRQIAITER